MARCAESSPDGVGPEVVFEHVLFPIDHGEHGPRFYVVRIEPDRPLETLSCLEVVSLRVCSPVLTGEQDTLVRIEALSAFHFRLLPRGAGDDPVRATDGPDYARGDVVLHLENCARIQLTFVGLCPRAAVADPRP
jgi:hypothetical protein